MAAAALDSTVRMRRVILLMLLLSLELALASINLSDVPCGKIARGSRRFHARIMGGACDAFGHVDPQHLSGKATKPGIAPGRQRR